jgi:hypothetical protein
MRQAASLRAAAERLIAIVDEQHRSKEPPLKYAAPWGAIAVLRAALDAMKTEPRQHVSSASEPDAQNRVRAGAEKP